MPSTLVREAKQYYSNIWLFLSCSRTETSRGGGQSNPVFRLPAPFSLSMLFLFPGPLPHNRAFHRAFSCLREWFHVNAHLSTADRTQSWWCMGVRRAGIVGVGSWTVGSREEKGWGQAEGGVDLPLRWPWQQPSDRSLVPDVVQHTHPHMHTSTAPPTGARLPYYLRS